VGAPVVTVVQEIVPREALKTADGNDGRDPKGRTPVTLIPYGAAAPASRAGRKAPLGRPDKAMVTLRTAWRRMMISSG
jgi:hypothetical protein